MFYIWFMKSRDFIQETIDQLRSSASQMDILWIQFQEGEIDKETFEDKYTSIIRDGLIDDLNTESFYPNNSCKYYETKPDCDNFKKLGI